jgi:hypothetical protein
MELQFRAVPWTTNSGAGGATWPPIVGELQLSARHAINARLTFALRCPTRMNPSPPHLAGSVHDLTYKFDPARVAEQVGHDQQVRAISITEACCDRPKVLGGAEASRAVGREGGERKLTPPRSDSPRRCKSLLMPPPASRRCCPVLHWSTDRRCGLSVPGLPPARAAGPAR